MATAMVSHVLEHNQAAVEQWDAGGKSYDNVSFAISDALAHAAARLNARAGEEVLDVGTGTGWTARNVARSGAHVTAVDIAPALLRAAQDLSAHVTPPIDYLLADAEDLPFEAASFDKIISTFGVMFAGDHERAARELARVCRRGGRLCLATWAPTGSIARLFAVFGSHSKAPAPERSPLLWGEPSYLTRLLGRQFILRFEEGVSHAYFDNVHDIWDTYIQGFGPLRTLYKSLDQAGRVALRKDIDEYHRHYQVECGLHVTREYLITIGERR